MDKYETMRQLQIRYEVYSPVDEALGGLYEQLPGEQLFEWIESYSEISGEDFFILERRGVQSARKLCMMWYVGDQSLLAERKFYSMSIKEAPLLYGETGIQVQYHLQALILFARSAMDTASTIFGWTLPDHDLCELKIYTNKFLSRSPESRNMRTADQILL